MTKLHVYENTEGYEGRGPNFFLNLVNVSVLKQQHVSTRVRT